MGILYLKNQEFSPGYRRVIRSSISLIYVPSTEFVIALKFPSFEGVYYAWCQFKGGIYSFIETYSILLSHICEERYEAGRIHI